MSFWKYLVTHTSTHSQKRVIEFDPKIDVLKMVYTQKKKGFNICNDVIISPSHHILFHSIHYILHPIFICDICLYSRFILLDIYHQDLMNDILAASKMVTPHSQNVIMHVIWNWYGNTAASYKDNFSVICIQIHLGLFTMKKVSY